MTKGIKALDVLPPTARSAGTIRVVLWLSDGMEETIQKLCGQDAVITGKYILCDEDRQFFSVVPLLDTTREEALKLAAYHGSDTFGVTPLRNSGWGIRVRATQYETAAQKIRPEDFQTITGPLFEVSGFPENTSEEGVRQFLGDANPLLEVKRNEKYGWGDGKRRKFLVKVGIPILYGSTNRDQTSWSRAN